MLSLTANMEKEVRERASNGSLLEVGGLPGILAFGG